MIWYFYLLEFTVYLPRAIFVFMGNYFNQLNFSDLQNGILGSVAAIVILFSNPFWMRFADRRTKNNVLASIAFSSSLLIWGIYIFKGFWPVLVMAFVVGFTWTSILPIAESMSIAYLNEHGFSFGKARMMGSAGFAGMMVFLGYLKSSFAFFAIGSAIFAFIGFAALSVLPKMKGYNVGKEKLKFSFKDLPGSLYRMLILEILVISSGNFGLYFFPILMKSRGYSVAYAGVAMAVHALSELPFLFFADRIVKKLGTKKMIVIASLLYGMRWILTWYFRNPIIVIALQSFEFFNFIAIYYAIWHYVSFRTDIRHRSDAQTVFWMTTIGFSAIFGYVVGGWVSDFFGVNNSYLFFGILSIVSALFYLFFEEFHRDRTVSV